APLAAFSIPFLIQKQGLPTGDAQKAIYWAQSISQHGNLPDYSLSYLKLNRDPVDFYTPGLHTTIALLLDMAPHDMPAVGFFAILASLVAAVIAASIGKDIFDTPGKIFPATLIMLLVLTNTRFLRYLREPGYHLQNVVGEVLLFGLLMLALSLIHRWRTKDAILACICAIALLVSHQFSSFIAAFALAPALVIFIVSRRHMVINTIRQHPTFGIAGILTGTALGVGGLMLGLQAKIPYLFTATPHLLQELPALTDYPRLLGNWWFALGFTGLLLLGIHTFRKHLHRRETAAFCLTTLVLFVLSQAPRFFIDTPPIRALFYLVIPLSICGAYLLAMLLSYVNSIPAMKARLAGKSTILFLLAVGTIYSTIQAYQEVPVSSRTNATLTPGLEYMIKNISKYVSEGSVLSDDYNKRSGSWLLLSGRPTFSRLASDLRRPMLESRQSAERMDMYIKQLDFEKIYSLGNWPGIVPLMNKHGITAVVGAVGSSASVFSHNPLLQTAAAVDSMYVFGLHPAKTVSDNTDPDRAAWLLKASTLANDIGDDEDTFQKLPASLP
ncbi:MAG: hypothetical protein HY006_01490, partial [Candidatus Sungbacteria bacterium]|nr:hypothetical protein [Candidatus Sungbacteria bacterium]